MRDLFIVKASKGISLNVIGISYFEEVVVTLSAENEWVMTMQDLKLFDERQIRTIWDEAQEKWHFSVVDVIEVLTDSSDVRQYIKRLRQRDPELNFVWGTICTPHQFISTKESRTLQTLVGTSGSRAHTSDARSMTSI